MWVCMPSRVHAPTHNATLRAPTDASRAVDAAADRARVRDPLPPHHARSVAKRRCPIRVWCVRRACGCTAGAGARTHARTLTPPHTHTPCAGPAAQCQALLLFASITTCVLLPPLLLLAPEDQCGSGSEERAGAASSCSAKRLLGRADAWLERWLRLLMRPRAQAQQQRQRQQQPSATLATIMLRWWVLLSACWWASVAVAGPVAAA